MLNYAEKVESSIAYKVRCHWYSTNTRSAAVEKMTIVPHSLAIITRVGQKNIGIIPLLLGVVKLHVLLSLHLLTRAKVPIFIGGFPSNTERETLTFCLPSAQACR